MEHVFPTVTTSESVKLEHINTYLKHLLMTYQIRMHSVCLLYQLELERGFNNRASSACEGDPTLMNSIGIMWLIFKYH